MGGHGPVPGPPQEAYDPWNHWRSHACQGKKRIPESQLFWLHSSSGTLLLANHASADPGESRFETRDEDKHFEAENPTAQKIPYGHSWPIFKPT